MSEKKDELTGTQKFVLAGMFGIMHGLAVGYCSLSDEQKKELHKKTAEHMLDAALKGRITEPYDKYEIEFIKEGLRM